MTNKQITKALELAYSNESFSQVDISTFMGYGKKGFQPIHCTLRQVAYVIRSQCFQFNGEIDAEEFDDFCQYARKLFIVHD